MIEVRPVESRRARRDFVAVPAIIYRDEKNYIPRLALEMRNHISKKNPYFAHAHHQLFVAYDEGRPVGRISAQIDTRAQREGEGMLGHFGFLDAQRPEIVAPLLQAAQDWLKAQGATRVMGPFSFSVNDESGLLIEGFDSPPYVLMNHAPQWLGGAVEAAGYAKAKDLIAFHMDTATPFPPAATRLATQAHTLNGFSIRPIAMPRLRAELYTMLGIFNEAWRNNWGFIEMTPAETDYMAHNMKPLLIPKLGQIASMHGQPAGMILALPNLMELIRDLRGRLFPFGWAKLITRLKLTGPRSVRVLLMGIRSEYREGITGAALSARLIYDLRKECLKRNVRWVEMSWILEDNTPMIRLIEAVGGFAYKRYRIYAKELV